MSESEKVAENFSVESATFPKEMAASKDEVAKDYFRERNRVRQSKRYFSPGMIHGLNELLECGTCQKPFTGNIIVTPLGKTICAGCKLKSKTKKRSKAKLYVANVTLDELYKFATEKLNIPLKDKNKPIPACLNDTEHDDLKSILSCKCGVILLQENSINLCRDGHSLCAICKICACGKPRTESKNLKLPCICKILNELEAPKNCFKCMIDSRTEDLPKDVLYAHAKNVHASDCESTCDWTDTPGEKRSRLYQVSVSTGLGDFSKVLVSDYQRKDILFLNGTIKDDYVVKYSITAISLEEKLNKPHQPVPVTIKIKKGTERGELTDYKNELLISEVQFGKKMKDNSHEVILSQWVRLNNLEITEALKYITFYIVLGSEADIDKKDMSAAAMGSCWTPMQYQ